MRLRQQPGLENRLPLLHGLFDVDRTDQTIFRHPSGSCTNGASRMIVSTFPSAFLVTFSLKPLLPLIRLGRVGVAIRILHALDRR